MSRYIYNVRNIQLQGKCLQFVGWEQKGLSFPGCLVCVGLVLVFGGGGWRLWGGGGWWVGRFRLRAWQVGLLGHLSVPLPDRWHFPLPAQCSGPRHQSRGCLGWFPLVPLVASCQVLCLCLGWACLVWWFGVVFLSQPFHGGRESSWRGRFLCGAGAGSAGR